MQLSKSNPRRHVRKNQGWGINMMCEEKTLSIEMAKTADADDRVWEASSTQSWADRRWQTKPSGLHSATDESSDCSPLTTEMWSSRTPNQQNPHPISHLHYLRICSLKKRIWPRSRMLLLFPHDRSLLHAPYMQWIIVIDFLGPSKSPTHHMLKRRDQSRNCRVRNKRQSGHRPSFGIYYPQR